MILCCNFPSEYAGEVALMLASYSNSIVRSDISRGGDHLFAIIEFKSSCAADLIAFESTALDITHSKIEITIK